jgi:hypothetical protein
MAMYEKDGALSRDKKSHGGGSHHDGGSKGHPHVHFHKHDGGVTGHVMHHDGTHEVHHFDQDDHEGMAALLQQHMSGGAPGEAPGEEQAEAGGAPGGAPQEQAA